MDPRVEKLGILLGDPALARSLVAIGLDSPRKIKAASDEELDAALGKGKRQAIREAVRPPQAGKK